MLKIKILLFFLTVVSFTFGQKSKDVVISIQGEVVTKSDVFDLLSRRYPVEVNEVIRELVVRHVVKKESQKEKLDIPNNEIIEKVLEEIADTKKKVETELGKSWKDHLESQSITEKSLKRDLFIKWKYSIFLQQLIRLFELRHKFIEARHIMVETKEEALEIIQKLKQGAAFSILAEQKSKAVTTKRNGGKLPTAFIGELPADMEKAIWNMKSGELSEPIFSSGAYHVVEIINVNNGMANASWSSLREEIKQSLLKKPITPRDFGRWLNHMKRIYKITEKLE